MSHQQEVIYTLDFEVRRRRERNHQAASRTDEPAECAIPRIARLMALAIRMEGLVRKQTIRDYAELARLGGVSRARMTQIVQLLDLAPDIQEQLLFLPSIKGINERNLRPIARQIDWREQRRLFLELNRHWDRGRDPA